MFDDEAGRATRLLEALIRSSGQTTASLRARSPRLRSLDEALEGREEISLQLLVEALRHLEVPAYLFFGALFPQPVTASGGPALSDRLQERAPWPHPDSPEEIPTPSAEDLEQRIRTAIEQALGR